MIAAATASARALAPLLALALAACGGKPHTAAPRPAAPALFASIPADTPFVLASFEAMPLEVLAMYRDLVGPEIRSSLERASGGGAWADRLLPVLLEELDGKWNVAGFESLGLSATPRFAIYGLGLVPVLRLEIRDGRVLLATIQRIAKRAGLPLPPPEAREGRTFWWIDDSEHPALLAITGDQLALAIGPRGALDAALPHVLGLEKPARSMADGAELAAARQKHRLGGQAVGIADTRRLLTNILAAGRPSPACAAEIDRLAARAPRLVAGYGVTPAQHDIDMVLEVAPDLAGELRSLRVDLPGYAQALADKPLLMVAAGVDLPRGQALLRAAVEATQRAAAACDATAFRARYDEAAALFAEPLPPPLAQLRGGLLNVLSASYDDDDALPSRLEAFAVVSSPAASSLFALGRAVIADAVPIDFEADGKLHTLPLDRLQLALPYEIAGGASERAIFLAAGKQGRARLERALGAPPDRAPLFITDTDYGRFSELSARRGGERASVNAINAQLYGRMRMALDVSDRGLELRTAVETKPRAR
ncbi:MAG TPA: hypothetical protein VNO30_49360 [Kofleriaceae bacterium]|nr:hypothetical protein [Kofleriaceae bacterium]